jgi:hypothetical protein
MVQLTTGNEQRTFVIEMFYETNSLQHTRGDFELINFVYQFPTVEECYFDEYVASIYLTSMWPFLTVTV